ncbi:MAG: carotenoid 1,2-hydratase [Alphaproteobacteria bacterium]|nr:carotenoid 1,2-hydratase [Alphaproteobacteria bacterium]
MKVSPGGYLWWYVDALSDDGAYGLTMIAFVGSVFSPYYAWSGRRDPENHVALNVALYGPNGRWTMTERGRRNSTRGRDTFELGGSMMRVKDDRVIIDVNEIGAPAPLPVKGRISVGFDALGDTTFLIDGRGRHRWRPLAPSARVSVDFAEPNVRWSGHGYFDTNNGDEPLEDGFEFWDWSRTQVDGGRTAILYNTDLADGGRLAAAYLVDAKGSVEAFEPKFDAGLPSTPIWRIKRRTRADDPDGARIVRTFEDTPFYSRSMVATNIFGKARIGVHESFDGPRLRNGIVKSLLPFRMPRLA